jgi:polyisoprenoid-binding protein YceI
MVTGDLTIRGVMRQAILYVSYLGPWETPWWEDGKDKGPKTRAGFVAKTKINRHDFGVSWNSTLEKGGIVVGNMVEITWKVPDHCHLMISAILVKLRYSQ